MLKNKELLPEAAKGGIWVLSLLTLINLFNYLDRYILVALSPSIKRELSLTDTQVGFLTTAFMFSYFLISPLFGWLGDRKPRFKVMSVGIALWSVATVFSGMARGFSGLLNSRFAIGVGEAAYGSISPSVLTDLYPKSVRGKIFAIFFMAIPVGSALGFLLGGLLEEWVGWRHAFFFAGVPGILLAIALLFLREPERGAYEEEKAAALSLKETYAALAKNPTYVLTVLGFCAYTFVLGGVAVWIPHFIERYLGVSASKGNMAFGAITVLAGFLGTFLGGIWADKWARRSADAYLKLSALSMFAALPVFILVLHTRNFSAFCALIFALEFLLFLSTSPINAQIVNCVSPSMRATANAVGIFMIHLLGDALSPPLVGYVSERTNLLLAMYIFTVVIFLSGFIWLAKTLFYWDVMPWPEQALVLPKAQCHRGYHYEGIQENTLMAFKAAQERGSDMVELDVHLSKDGIPVVIHDADIRRVSGRDGLVLEKTAAELGDLAKAPSLESVLRGIDIKVNIELKSESVSDLGLEKAVAAVVQSVKGEHRVLFSSFNPFSLRRLSKLLPDVPRALLISGDLSDPKNKFYLRRGLLAFLARPHMLNLDQSLFMQWSESLLSRKVPAAVWTIDDPNMARKFLAMGAESIISSKTDIL